MVLHYGEESRFRVGQELVDDVSDVRVVLLGIHASKAYSETSRGEVLLLAC